MWRDRNQSRDNLYQEAANITDTVVQLNRMKMERERNRDRSFTPSSRNPYHEQQKRQWPRNPEWRQPPNFNQYNPRVDTHPSDWDSKPWRGQNQNQQREQPHTNPRVDTHPRDCDSFNSSARQMEECTTNKPWRGQNQNQQREQPHYNPKGYEVRKQPHYNPKSYEVVQQLITTLTTRPNFSITLLKLFEEYNLDPNFVRRKVSEHEHIFEMQGEVILLAPRLELCTFHHSDDGCQMLIKCSLIHICPKYVWKQCSNGMSCIFGHNWFTDHNLRILKRLYLENLKHQTLCKLIQNKTQQARPLGVCEAYNGTGCDKLVCSDLHVCISFLKDLAYCTIEKCQLSHNLLTPACISLLKFHNLPFNDSPRDVAMALIQANPSLKDIAIPSVDADPSVKVRPIKKTAKQWTEKDKNTKDSQQSDTKNKKVRINEESSESSSDIESENENENYTHKGKKNQMKNSYIDIKKGKGKARGTNTRVIEKNIRYSTTEEESDDNDNHTYKSNSPRLLKSQETTQPSTRSTVWAHYLYGDVPIPQICYYSVETLCRNEGNGCQKLHATAHFHWQVKQQNGPWFNLRRDQTICIEKAFCDPALNYVDLPRLDPAKLEPSVSGLFLLLGRHVWQACFNTNSLTSSTDNKQLDLRRLCTETVSGQTIKASTYVWYFLDINQKWVKYGDAGRKNLVSNITSADIEVYYQSNPQQPLPFNNSEYLYNLDFISMKQINQVTGVSRVVQRRPYPHLEDKDKNQADSDFPLHWDIMQSEEPSLLVTLGPGTEEYKEVVSFLGIHLVSKVVNVDRFQNRSMWNALQNSIKDMTALYKDKAKVNIKYLFHGTSYNNVNCIIKENFDWRLHGTSSGQLYGRGVYFGINANLSYNYCQADQKGLKYMFMAKVAVGSVTKGNSSMVRPPINPNTSMPFDSTVDNITNPTMVVKYKEKEYYPEYLITLV